MKYCFVLLVALAACTSPVEPPPLEMLEGKWVRTNDKGGFQTHEMWRSTDTGYVGVGLTMQTFPQFPDSADVVFKEQLHIKQEGQSYYYVVTGVNEEPTRFKFKEWNTYSFVCENLDNEFPKRINYRMARNFMIAELTGNGDTVTFDFMKVPFVKESADPISQ